MGAQTSPNGAHRPIAILSIVLLVLVASAVAIILRNAATLNPREMGLFACDTTSLAQTEQARRALADALQLSHLDDVVTRVQTTSPCVDSTSGPTAYVSTRDAAQCAAVVRAVSLPATDDSAGLRWSTSCAEVEGAFVAQVGLTMA
jgi:hypothetical protein